MLSFKNNRSRLTGFQSFKKNNLANVVAFLDDDIFIYWDKNYGTVINFGGMNNNNITITKDADFPSQVTFAIDVNAETITISGDPL